MKFNHWAVFEHNRNLHVKRCSGSGILESCLFYCKASQWSLAPVSSENAALNGSAMFWVKMFLPDCFTEFSHFH